MNDARFWEWDKGTFKSCKSDLKAKLRDFRRHAEAMKPKPALPFTTIELLTPFFKSN